MKYLNAALLPLLGVALFLGGFSLGMGEPQVCQVNTPAATPHAVESHSRQWY